MNQRTKHFYIWTGLVIAVVVVCLLTLMKISDFKRSEDVSLMESAFNKVKKAFQIRKEIQGLPEEIIKNKVFVDWSKKNNIGTTVFEMVKKETLKFDLPMQTIYSSAKECERAFINYPAGYYLVNPDNQKVICMGNFGEPDSYVILFGKTKQESGRLRFCGTPCGFDGGFWLDNDRFVLLENATDDGISRQYSFEIFDFKNKTQQRWEAKRTNKIDTTNQTDAIDTSTWKTYRNEEHGFELRYPSDWNQPRDFESGLPGVPNGANVFKVSKTQTYPNPEFPLDALVYVYEDDNPDNLSLQNFFQREYENCLLEEKKREQAGKIGSLGCPGYEDVSLWQETVVGGITAVRSGKRHAPGAPLSSDSVYITLNKRFFIISAIYYNESYKELDNIFNQILSTFKFIK